VTAEVGNPVYVLFLAATGLNKPQGPVYLRDSRLTVRGVSEIKRSQMAHRQSKGQGVGRLQFVATTMPGVSL
jgi:hypothetical protein